MVCVLTWRREHCAKWHAEGTEEMDSQSCTMQAPIVEIRMPAKLEEHHLNEESKIKAATKGRGQSC